MTASTLWASVIFAFFFVGTMPSEPRLEPSSGESYSGLYHGVICEIAWLRMEPNTKSFIRSIGWGDTRQFAESCGWADQVQNTTHRHTDAYHFVNIAAGSDRFVESRDCDAPDRCVTWAVPHYGLILQDPSSDPQARSEALRFLAHFVGDVHQPLHASRAADRGGNTIEVEFFDREVNLHAAWDRHILRRAGITSRRAANRLNAQISDADADRWSDTDVVGWTMESFQFALDVAYPSAEDGLLNSAEQDLSAEIAMEQLQRAGVRLAHLLNCAANGNLRFTSP